MLIYFFAIHLHLHTHTPSLPINASAGTYIEFFKPFGFGIRIDENVVQLGVADLFAGHLDEDDELVVVPTLLGSCDNMLEVAGIISLKEGLDCFLDHVLVELGLGEDTPNLLGVFIFRIVPCFSEIGGSLDVANRTHQFSMAMPTTLQISTARQYFRRGGNDHATARFEEQAGEINTGLLQSVRKSPLGIKI